ncbi:MAG: GxxExxY protein [Bacteroidetes bacterium]|nr:GxxExxY protein [Bacteroidota bacterium]
MLDHTGFANIVAEIKMLDALSEKEESQIINYLVATGCLVCLYFGQLR